MKSKLLAKQSIGRSFIVVFDTDDDVLRGLQRFFDTENIAAAKLFGVGGFRRATLGYFDMEQKRYLPIDVDEQVEVLSILGNVAAYQGKPRLHAHCVVGHRDGHTSGGHLLTGVVRPTLEVMIDELPSGLTRTDRPEIGIPLIQL
jgi:uncharacterized protein